ncbi:MAG TPA: YdcF family protein [Bacteroidales bacterium]|nr:YdcF family protein [Bacteroidales bacterium]
MSALNIKSIIKVGKLALLRLMMLFGIIAALMTVLSFTDLPWHAYYRLGTGQIDRNPEADYIVVLGAGAVPGHHSLLRCWYAAKAAEELPEAQLIVALPADSNATNTDHQRMIDELVMRGIARQRILSEKKGRNTHVQAINIRKIVNDTDSRLLLITSPEHMYRSILTFRKAGFSKVNGLPTFESAFDDSLLIDSNSSKGRRLNAEQNLDLRYNMWSYLQYQIIVLREYAAIAWYKLNGYI